MLLTQQTGDIALRNEPSLNQLENANGGIFMLLFYGIASKPTNAPRPGGETYETAVEEAVLNIIMKKGLQQCSY
jgi:hypothetical protein|tara:strand:+ start:2022 stop:2243 length:222 start_codon:yes stop_codon:yes gene_type:complete